MLTTLKQTYKRKEGKIRQQIFKKFIYDKQSFNTLIAKQNLQKNIISNCSVRRLYRCRNTQNTTFLRDGNFMRLVQIYAICLLHSAKMPRMSPLILTGMEPSLRKKKQKKPELFFTMTTVSTELVFNAVTARL